MMFEALVHRVGIISSTYANVMATDDVPLSMPDH